MATNEDVLHWIELQPPPSKGVAPSAEEQARLSELAAVREKWLATRAEALGVGKKKLAKDLDKKRKKLAPKKAPSKAPKPPTSSTAAEKPPTAEELAALAAAEAAAAMRRELPQPEANVGRGQFHVNSAELLADHLKETGGKWVTRFPPEPNGYLHIGHAKAMGFNFGQAKKNGGVCYLRFDDTNPEAEKQEYIDSITDNVRWLGHEPWKITYSSDYFERLHACAVELIKRGGAYVCHQKPEEVKASRDLVRTYHNDKAKAAEAGEEAPVLPAGAASPYRDRPVEENLAEFEKMRSGAYAEGEAVLRMKMDLLSPNPNLWDHMAYRIKSSPHPRSGTQWVIYPTYDYTHCLVDSFENVTHSMCTLEPAESRAPRCAEPTLRAFNDKPIPEPSRSRSSDATKRLISAHKRQHADRFETRQAPASSYHWLLHALGQFHPFTWEFARCSISGNVLSKRRLNRLVTEGHVAGPVQRV